MKTLIIGNGPPPPEEIFKRLAAEAQLIIAADGGARYCVLHGVYPQVVIGDFDSIDAKMLEELRLRAKIIGHPVDKDSSDLELACRHAESAGATELTIFSWADERIDYTLDTLLSLRDVRIPTSLIGNSFLIYILNEISRSHSWSDLGRKVSIGSLSPTVSLKTSGLQWDLDWNNLPSPQLSLSNRCLSRSRIDILKGSAFLLIET